MVTKTTEEATTDVWAAEPKALVSNREFLTVTLKAGTGYDAPWLVTHANSVEEALEFLKHPDLEELMDLTARKGKELAKAFGGAPSLPKPAGGSGWSNKTETVPKVSAGAVKGRTCPHVTDDNPIVKRTGNKNGKDWTGFFCPETDRDNQCTPEFLR